MSTDCPTPLLSSGIPLTYAKLLDKSLVGQQQNVSKSFAGWMRHISHTKPTSQNRRLKQDEVGSKPVGRFLLHKTMLELFILCLLLV